jgi:hypothetical protein
MAVAVSNDSFTDVILLDGLRKVYDDGKVAVQVLIM